MTKAIGGIKAPNFKGQRMTKVLEVAAKLAKADVGAEATSSFLEEAMIMSQFHHRNILRLLGVCTTGINKGKPTILVLEFCQHGELKSFLRSSKEFRVLTLAARLAISSDIAKGMAYLCSLKFVHRDLASRNVLVNSKYVCKVADFGMTRGTKKNGFDGDYYRSKGGVVPVRWTSIEAMKDNLFTEASDVWAFGVTLYGNSNTRTDPLWVVFFLRRGGLVVLPQRRTLLYSIYADICA